MGVEILRLNKNLGLLDKHVREFQNGLMISKKKLAKLEDFSKVDSKKNQDSNYSD